jgi:integrase
MSSPTLVRTALDACARTTDGSRAAATTVCRKRVVLYNALGFAVEQELLDSNPIDKVQWKAPEVAATLDRRVVANPAQAEALLAGLEAQGERGQRLAAFFDTIYYAALRPAEALALRENNCVLPNRGWGRLNVSESSPKAGADWTDDGNPREHRGLKHRGQRETRSVPILPS